MWTAVSGWEMYFSALLAGKKKFSKIAPWWHRLPVYVLVVIFERSEIIFMFERVSCSCRMDKVVKCATKHVFKWPLLCSLWSCSLLEKVAKQAVWVLALGYFRKDTHNAETDNENNTYTKVLSSVESSVNVRALYVQKGLANQQFSLRKGFGFGLWFVNHNIQWREWN